MIFYLSLWIEKLSSSTLGNWIHGLSHYVFECCVIVLILLLLCLLLYSCGIFYCFPFNFRKSTWITILNIKHVINNPFYGHFTWNWYCFKEGVRHLFLEFETFYKKTLETFQLLPSGFRGVTTPTFTSYKSINVTKMS